MFSSIRKMLGMIKVVEQGDFVLVSGLPADFINFSINKIWATSKIATNMFNRVTNSQLVFHKFFVPDVIYTLNVVKKDKRARSNVKVIESVIDGLYQNTWAKSILEEHKPFLDRSKLSLFNKKPLEHQNRFFDTYEDSKSKYQLKGYLLGAAPGSGKAHSLDVKLKSPNGDILMRDIKVGDVLYNRRFKPTVVTGVFPQGKKDIYLFKCEDGRSTEVCLEHLWKVYHSDKSEVINTQAVRELLKNGVDVSIDLPDRLGLTESMQFDVSFHVNCCMAAIEKEELKYRSRGAVVNRITSSDGVKLSVEFRANKKIRVTSIEFIARKEAQCISVDNEERLYIVDDYVVTHNTLMSVMLSRMLGTDTNIFIVPKNALDRVWSATLLTELKEPKAFWISNGDKALDKGYTDYIVHYDYMNKFMDFIGRYSGDFGNVFMNLDESHNFNDIKSLRTEMLVDLAKEVQTNNYLAMSGTPIKAIGTEAVPLLRIIDPYFNEKVEDRFLKIYGKSQSRANDILQNRMGMVTFKVDKAETVGNTVHHYNGYITIPNGSDYTLDSIRQEMKRFIEERMRYYKSERSGFDKEYQRIIKIHKSQLDNRAERAEFDKYEKAVELIRNKYDPVLRKEDIVFSNKYERYKIIPKLDPKDKHIFRDVKSVYKYYFLKVQGEALGRVLGRLRVQCNVDMVKGLDNVVIKDGAGKVVDTISIEEGVRNAEKKSLVFTSFVEVIHAAEAYFKSKGFKPLIVYGETNKDLANIVGKFGSDPDANPLIATFKSLSTAVPLTMANNTYMLNAPFRDYEREQAISRTDRIGQDTDVYNTTILLDTNNKPNISTRSNDIMEWSKTQIEEIMGFKIDTDQVSIEDLREDLSLEDKKVESLAEKLDMGVSDLTGEDDLPMIETDKGKKRASSWSVW